MKKIIFTAYIFSLLSSCSAQTPKTDVSEQKKESTTIPAPSKLDEVMKKKAKDCVCVQLYMPVCGSDQKTYSNSCMAQCAGVEYTQGECRPKK